MKKFLDKYGIYVFFALCFIVCLLRALKGFCWTDESFYLSTADRFFKGDILLKEEWYRTQLSSVICLLFYAPYVFITGSNEGVILFFRILYLILSFVTAITTFKIIKKKYPKNVALILATLIIFYAHLNVTALSYQMMSMDFLLISLMMIYDYANTRSVKELIGAGAVLALAVLSMPALTVGYIIVMVCVFLAIIIRKTGKLSDRIAILIDDMELAKISIYTIIGILCVAVVFFIYMFSRLSVSELIAAIPNILIDNEHDFTFGFLVRKYFRSIKEVYGRWAYISYFLIVVSFLAGKFIKNRIVRNVIVLADFVLFIVLAVKSFGHTGYIQAALCLFAIPVFFLSQKKNSRLFWIMTTGGMILSVTFCFTSSDFLYVMALGYFIVATGCIPAMYDYAESEWIDERDANTGEVSEGTSANEKELKMGFSLSAVAATVLTLTALYVCCVTIGLRISNVYRDAPISRLNCKIVNGPAKGLYTTVEHAQQYEEVCQVIDKYGQGEGNILFSKVLCWGYLYSNMRCGYPTTWRATAYNEDQLVTYYNSNPDKNPDVIIVLNEEYGSYDAAGDVEDDHNPNLDEMNEYWKNYISTMESVDEKCGTVYLR